MICKECNKICNAKRFQQNFKNWTSGNNFIDKFIQNTQLKTHEYTYEALEWVPYDRFYDIKYIAKGGFGKVYKANWIDGPIIEWDDQVENWKRHGQNKLVALKSLNTKNVSLEFMNEITSHQTLNFDLPIGAVIKFYGMTQDPLTENYMMILDYAEDGSLRNYLNASYNKLSWYDKISYLNKIAFGLENIHNNEIIHRDLHVGNILINRGSSLITDMGLCKPADYNTSENTKNEIYGVLPYIAPEILRGQNYTKASDIYSFGIIMYEVISGLPPYHDVSHDKYLAIRICQGLRPRFHIKVPQLIVHLIKRCLDANPLDRPKVNEIEKILDQWKHQLQESRELDQTELKIQIKEADEINSKLSINNFPLTNLALSYETHSEAIYTSRLLNFNNLPKPRNSNDYYNDCDNTITAEYSESLQIDISQLNINKDGKC
ncbi:hypothetical protein RclHR1_03220016 [Rhizophagus clarus]|uniref:Protein kinase domain-containing protein n=1 Tax=Rhizophagus clarus TaxID=94130 RepID=A0A2Z6R858_9GLOM|nr:hypothetical protein RclHR1_03220016 [Rhizophagus clarus]